MEDTQVSACTQQHPSLMWVLMAKVSLFKRFSFMNRPPVQTSLRSPRITFECPQLNQAVVCLGSEILIVSGRFSSHRHQSHLGVNEPEALQISVTLHSHGDISDPHLHSFSLRGGAVNCVSSTPEPSGPPMRRESQGRIELFPCSDFSHGNHEHFFHSDN